MNKGIVVIFDGANYPEWEIYMTALLREKGCWRVVSEDPLSLKKEETKKSESYLARHEKWADKNEEALGRITGRVQAKFAEEFRDMETAAEV